MLLHSIPFDLFMWGIFLIFAFDKLSNIHTGLQYNIVCFVCGVLGLNDAACRNWPQSFVKDHKETFTLFEVHFVVV